MESTQILKDEHEVISRVLSALEKEIDKAANGKSSPEFFLDSAEFIKGFTDGCHHVKEEGVLFKFMEEAGVPSQEGPIAVMLSDHEHGRIFTRNMREAAQRWQSGDKAAIATVVDNARAYVNLLRDHISKENTIVFPMADSLIPADKQPEITKAYDHIEHEETGAGVHEKYLALAEKLEKMANK